MIRMLKSLFLNLLFPPECLGCGQEGTYLCARCFKKLKFNGAERTAALTTNLKTSALAGIFIAGDYDDPLLASLIKKLKYNFLAELSPTLGQFLTLFWQGQLALIPNNELTDATLVPIPLSKKRLRWRGFNQAALLAREMAAAFAYPLNQDLKRIKHSWPQADLNGSERLNNIADSFAWTGTNLDGRTIILIDDVATTGATLNEAARVLKAAGAGAIYGLVLAKG